MSRFWYGAAWLMYGINVLMSPSLIGGASEARRADTMATACFFLLLALYAREKK